MLFNLRTVDEKDIIFVTGSVRSSDSFGCVLIASHSCLGYNAGFKESCVTGILG